MAARRRREVVGFDGGRRHDPNHSRAAAAAACLPLQVQRRASTRLAAGARSVAARGARRRTVARALAPRVAVGLARAQPATPPRGTSQLIPLPPARARASAETIADALAVLAAAADVLARQPFARGALAAAGALARARREVARVARRCAVGVAAPPLAARPVPPVVAHAAPAAAERAHAVREAEDIARRAAPLGLAHARAAPRIAAAVARATDALGRRARARAVLAARAAPAVGAHGRVLHDEGEPRRRLGPRERRREPEDDAAVCRVDRRHLDRLVVLRRRRRARRAGDEGGGGAGRDDVVAREAEPRGRPARRRRR